MCPTSALSLSDRVVSHRAPSWPAANFYQIFPIAQFPLSVCSSTMRV